MSLFLYISKSYWHWVWNILRRPIMESSTPKHSWTENVNFKVPCVNFVNELFWTLLYLNIHQEISKVTFERNVTQDENGWSEKFASYLFALMNIWSIRHSQTDFRKTITRQPLVKSRQDVLSICYDDCYTKIICVAQNNWPSQLAKTSVRMKCSNQLKFCKYKITQLSKSTLASYETPSLRPL